MAGAIGIRDATRDDVPFLAHIMLMASRGHLERGIWEWLFDLSPDHALAFLSALAVADEVQMCHHSIFVIAEVDGTPAAALCGFDATTQGQDVFTRSMPSAFAAAELELAFDEGFMERMAMAQRMLPEQAPGAWVIENVGAMPEYRRRGLVEKLMAHALERGRERGHDTAQISVLLGNAPARNAYTKAGFEVIDVLRDADLEASFGSAGAERLLRAI